MQRFAIGFLVGGLVTSALGLALTTLWPAKPSRMLGHYRYGLVDTSELRAVDERNDVWLEQKAARAFAKMQAAASKVGIQLLPMSGYRTLTKQQKLFFDDAAARGEVLRHRAKVCAPPGFSEHHTGYSLDLGDATHREAGLDLRFKDTPAFRWLKRNAARYHFEMSFPKGNRQKVEYEPWHWRYVGDLKSFKTFYYARFGESQ